MDYSTSNKKLKIIQNRSVDVISEIIDNPSILGKNSLSRDYKSINETANTTIKSSDNESANTAFKASNTKQQSTNTNKSEPNANNKFNLIENRNPTNFKRKIDCDEKEIKKRSLSELEIGEENSIPPRSSSKGMENYAQKNLARFNESSYNIMDIIETKRNLHNTATSFKNQFTSQQNLSNIKDPRVYRPKLNSNNPNLIDNIQSTKSNIGFSFRKQLELTRLSSSSLNKDSTSNQKSNSQFKQDFLYSILQWRMVWLKDPAQYDIENVLCDEKLKDLKLSYESFEEYLSYYKPLILNEIFSQICEKVESIKKIETRKYFFSNLFVHHYEIEDNYLILNCVLPVKVQDFERSSYPNEGDLLVVELNLCEKEKSIISLGYLSEFAIDDINEKTTFNFNFSNNCNKLLKFIIKLKVMNIKIDVTKTIKCAPIYYLKPSLRQCEALLNLDKSSLCEGIIKPTQLLKEIKLDNRLRDDGRYNLSQLNVISNAKELVNDSKPGILLVQGPPGAGKTHTLIGMVKKIFLEWKYENASPKILICAPSNGAIDEIGKRLFRAREFLKKSKLVRDLRIVRIGQEDKMSTYVKQNMFIETLIERNMKTKEEDKKNNYEKELIDKETQLRKLQIEENSLERDKKFDELKSIKSRINFMRGQVNYLEKLCLDSRKQVPNDLQKKKLRNDLLIKSDIVLTTLSSCCSSSLLQVFDNNRIFNCCIIDECSQCTEPELLMPLCFSSISKLILIGDPMQLPATTISPISSKYNFGRSLFERFYSYIREFQPKKEYLIMLNVQYRMHSEICSLPSRLFYNNKLGTDHRVDKRNFPLVPYMVFDVKDTIECRKNVKNIHNQKESEFVLKLASTCAGLINTYKQFDNQIVKIGIITPYQGQRKLLEEQLNQNNIKIRIEVNTIDGFQGREMDIIIISAVRSNKDQNGNIGFLNSCQRVNVAITRAKCSLFICLNASSLIKFDIWKCLIEDAMKRNCYQQCQSDIKSNFLENLIANLKFKC